MEKVKRVILIGLDGLMPEMAEKFVAEGNMPAIGRLMAEGVYSPMYSSPPVDTPTNWTSLATGAWTGTHGLNSFGIHFPGEPFDQVHWVRSNIFPRFANISKENLNQLSRAEYIWQAAERVGKRCILVNYPGGWPPNIKKGIVVDGSGPYSSPLSRLTYPSRYASKDGAISGEYIPLIFTEAKGWSGLVQSSPLPRESALVISGEVGLRVSEDGEWRLGGELANFESKRGLVYYLLITGSGHPGYDLMLLTKDRDAQRPLARLRPGEWSDWLCDDFQTPYGPVRGKFRVKLERLSPDGREVVLYRTPIYNTQGWTYPPEIADELIDHMLEFEEKVAAGRGSGLRHKVSPLCQVYESISDQCIGIAAMTRYLANKYPWDLLFVQIHAPDGLNHKALNEVCPQWKGYDPRRAKEAWERFRQEYGALDKAVGEIVGGCADGETLVIVLSDHAAIPTFKTVWLGRAFLDAGLLVYKRENGQLVVDWERTKAVLADQPLASVQPLALNVWVNLKGRERYGCVEPGEEYEQVRRAIIRALYALVDPETGECPVALALRREEASTLGQWGDTVGDVVYYFRPGYAGEPTLPNLEPTEAMLSTTTCFYAVGPEGIKTRIFGHVQGLHGEYLPNADLWGCSVRAVLVMAGPGIRKGHRLPVPPWTVDVTPTITHLLGIPAPAQSEGKIIGQALESTGG